MNDCCPTPDSPHSHSKRIDWIFWTCLPIVIVAYGAGLFFMDSLPEGTWLHIFVHAVHEFINTMWWGVLVGIAFLAMLSRVPREFVMSVLGSKRGLGGIFRATLAGVFLDLCSHGILMVGAKLYERGASIGQLMAFLIASPWNSFSMTMILIALIGLPWTAAFIVLSLVIAVITGLIFEALVARKILPANPNRLDVPANFQFFAEARKGLARTDWSFSLLADMALTGLRESKMVIRWLLFGIVIASALRVFIDADDFAQYFGPTMLGLGATVFFATVLEVCSEGSSPIAADILNRGGAPGNAFAFLMSGVSTDYTEVMVLKDTTRSWKIALFLPLVTLPQVILLAWFINVFSS